MLICDQVRDILDADACVTSVGVVSASVAAERGRRRRRRGWRRGRAVQLLAVVAAGVGDVIRMGRRGRVEIAIRTAHVNRVASRVEVAVGCTFRQGLALQPDNVGCSPVHDHVGLA